MNRFATPPKKAPTVVWIPGAGYFLVRGNQSSGCYKTEAQARQMRALAVLSAGPDRSRN